MKKYVLDDLCSPGYREQLGTMAWGRGGIKYIADVVALVPKQSPGMTYTILDYGCGPADLGPIVRERYPKRTDIQFVGYDPAIPGKQALPKPAYVVCCLDVLEHIEPDKLDAVLDHLFSVTIVRAFFVVAMRPADKRLPDGRNAHLIIDNAKWWHDKIAGAGAWKLAIQIIDAGGAMKVWARKP